MIEISYSQSNTFRTCRRQWSYSRVEGLNGIPNPIGTLGTRYHAKIEEHIKSGEKSENKYVSRALESLMGLNNIEAEKYIEHFQDDYKFRGYADVVADGVVIDWKFPMKDPGTKPNKKHKDQLNLYAYLLEAEECRVVFPEYDKAFSFKANHDYGKKVLEGIYKVAQEIDETNAWEIPALEQKATPNGLCKEWCAYRSMCPHGGLYEAS